jgi:uncharacterized protein
MAAPAMSYAGATPAAPATSPGWPVWPPPTALPAMPGPPQPAAVSAADSGRLLDHQAGVLVAVAIGIGAVMQVIAFALAQIVSLEPETLIRYDLVLTVGMYAIVAAMLISQITPSVRLRWGDGPLVVRVGIGAAAGVGISLLLLALVSAATGHLEPDPRLVLLMSEGDPTHIIVTVFLACVAAPVVEETLFRGLLLESLRGRGRATAVVVSAGAFAVWHFMPASLVYYTALGAALGGLYLARGLACSMAAHVGFNAVLTIAAISVVLGPSHVVDVDGLAMTAPSGWSVARLSPLAEADEVLVGPSDALVAVFTAPAIGGYGVTSIASGLRSGTLPLPPGISVDRASVHEVQGAAGPVVEVAMTIDGRTGELAALATGGQDFELEFLSAGSEKAETDFAAMVSSLRPA